MEQWPDVTADITVSYWFSEPILSQFIEPWRLFFSFLKFLSQFQYSLHLYLIWEHLSYKAVEILSII